MSVRLKQAMEGDGFIHGLVDAVRPRLRPGEDFLEAVQRLVIHDALDQCLYTQIEAAKMLRLKQGRLFRHVKSCWPRDLK